MMQTIIASSVVPNTERKNACASSAISTHSQPIGRYLRKIEKNAVTYDVFIVYITRVTLPGHTISRNDPTPRHEGISAPTNK